MAVRQISSLGHWVAGEGVFPQHSKMGAVVKMPPPTDVAGLRRFLGMVGYCGMFNEQVAFKRKPLTKLTGKARRRVLDAAHEGAANGNLVAVTGKLSVGPLRGDPWMDAEAMADLQAGNVNMPQPYARYT
eukprot:jgi/Tetstr1/441182/TSEL_029440.t1